jgi:hypothetical protein
MPPLYILKEEIKALQAIAKMLTLNTHSFTETRLRLSECWDKARHLEKERKKEIAEKRVVFKQNYDVALVKIREFEQLVNTENLSSAELQRSFDEIGEYLRNIPLGRDEILSIREVFKPIRSVVLEKLKEEENERETELRKKEDSHKEIVSQLRKAIESLISKADSSTLETLVAEQSKLCAQYQEMSVNQAEKNQLDHLFKRLKDTVSDKEERVLLSTEDFNALEKLRDALNERKRLRAQIKSQLESYRKVLSESGFDFEKAMEIRETVENEKIRLDKVNGAISDIEDKIASLEA